MPHRLNFPRLKTLCLAFGFACCCATMFPLTAHAAIEDLWITEVLPATEEVEVTNVGTTPETITTSFRWCWRRTYSSVVSSDLTLQPGESMVFTVSGLGSGSADLWLYRNSSFGGASGEASIISGVRYGTSTTTWRTNVAVPAGIWDGVTSNAPFPAAGESLQLTGADPFSAASWSSGTPDFGSFGAPEVPEISAVEMLATGELRIEWTGGVGPYQVQSNTTLNAADWADLGSSTTDNEVTLDGSADQMFFRILSNLQPETATYDVIFDATWANGTHPNFPTNPHFSGLIGGTHGSGVTFWAPGGMATPGIEQMAETGSKFPLTQEVEAAIDAGTAEHLLSGGGIGTSPDSVTLRFEVSQDFPLVSLVSMIAPSPDWFVGVHDLDLFAGGQWAEDLTVDLPPYDSGTDSGTNFVSSNADTNPAEPIFQITGAPLAIGGTVAPFGTFRFVRVP